MGADWKLIACLKQLFAEFDRIAAGRDHASDGSIGDTAHQQEVSDHNPDETGSVPIHDADSTNEVHAIDVDDDLRTPGLTMEMVVQFLLKRCRSGAETRLRYIIYNRRIWEAKNGWEQRAYAGSSPHTEHAHFSASYDSAKEASTASWHLEEIPVPLTPDDIDWLDQRFKAIAEQVWSARIGNENHPSRTARQAVDDLSNERDALVDPAISLEEAGIGPGTPLARIIAAADKILGQGGGSATL
jgi:hypothetical protein